MNTDDPEVCLKVWEPHQPCPLQLSREGVPCSLSTLQCLWWDLSPSVLCYTTDSVKSSFTLLSSNQHFLRAQSICAYVTRTTQWLACPDDDFSSWWVPGVTFWMCFGLHLLIVQSERGIPLLEMHSYGNTNYIHSLRQWLTSCGVMEFIITG